jgi:hypothetical protein
MSFYHQNSFRKKEKKIYNQNKNNRIASQKNSNILNKSEFYSRSIDIPKLKKDRNIFPIHNNYNNASRNLGNKIDGAFKNIRDFDSIFNNISSTMKIKHIPINKIKLNRVNNFKKKQDNTFSNLEQKTNSLPKINVRKNLMHLSMEELNKNDEKKTNSLKSIFSYHNNKKAKLIKKIELNNNNYYNEIMPFEEILNADFPFYKSAKHSENSFDRIIAYGVNTYQGLIRKYNEDRVTILINPLILKKDKEEQNDSEKYKISYFSIYDGHGGNKCCDFLKKYLHTYILESSYFPSDPVKAIEEGFKLCEKNFMNIVYLKNELIDTSGSCAIIILILNDTCYITNLGDSRALYSYNDGKKFYQISRDHKPNDPIEKNRIYLAGGSIYQTKPNLGNNFLFHGENMIERNEKLPYRIFPGCLSVSYILNYLVI